MDKLLAMKSFRDDMLIRNFSRKTITGYCSQLSAFFEYYGCVPQSVDIDKIRKYLVHLKTERSLSSSTINQAAMSIKMFYIRIMGLEWPDRQLGFSKVTNKLPVVLTQDEVGRILDQLTNLKHKAIICLIYSAGLRVSELLDLKITDIDSAQMYVIVRGGKGNKDRTTLLSTPCLELLRTYYREFKPVGYLFNGKAEKGQYSKTSIRVILERAVKKAGINKKVCIHTLRHSFATHLLESGVNLFYIKELLGHSSIKSTLVYLHLCHTDIRKIVNPLDKLHQNKRIW